MRRTLTLWLLSIATSTAFAAPVFRCGSTYSQTPCVGGVVVESTDPRTAAQRAEAKRVAERERIYAARMENERRNREAALKPAAATGFDSRASDRAETTAPKAAKRKAFRKGTKKEAASAQQSKDFVAVEPSKHP